MARLLFHNHDITATAYTYASYSPLINSPKYLITSGSSTTVSEFAAGNDTFAGFVNGDIIDVNVDGTHAIRVVTDATLAPDSVVVNTAVNWENSAGGRAFSFRRWENGTAATNGWIGVGGDDEKLIQINTTAVNSTSVDVTIEGRIRVGSTLNQTTIYSKSYTAAGNDFIPIGEDVDELRVGVQITGADAGANTIYVAYQGHPKVR